MTVPNDNELKKAWLKKRFASWEYHEEMLKLHEQFLQIVKQALKRPEVKQRYPELYTFFINVAIPNFEQSPKPGEIKKYEWDAGKTTGWARPIHDYNVALMDEDHWTWMTDQEREALWKVWIPMDHTANNTRRTVDNTWFIEELNSDDGLLDEEVTGPIDWPPNWKEEILADLGLAPNPTASLRALPGERCPKTGYWLIWHTPQSRRFINEGDVMPDYEVAKGAAVWSYDTDQAHDKAAAG